MVREEERRHGKRCTCRLRGKSASSLASACLFCLSHHHRQPRPAFQRDRKAATASLRRQGRACRAKARCPPIIEQVGEGRGYERTLWTTSQAHDFALNALIACFYFCFFPFPRRTAPRGFARLSTFFRDAKPSRGLGIDDGRQICDAKAERTSSVLQHIVTAGCTRLESSERQCHRGWRRCASLDFDIYTRRVPTLSVRAALAIKPPPARRSHRLSSSSLATADATAVYTICDGAGHTQPAGCQSEQ